MDQTIINWVLGGFGTLVGFLLSVLWKAIKDLQDADKQIVDKVSKIEVLVVGDYVKNERLDSMMGALFAKLDRIEEKLERKQDR